MREQCNTYIHIEKWIKKMSKEKTLTKIQLKVKNIETYKT